MVASSINCCLKAPANFREIPATIINKTSHSSWSMVKAKAKDDGNWTRRSLTTAASCVMIVTSVGDSLCNAVEFHQEYVPLMETKVVAGNRWSDRRVCPAWNVNSLESIVPENLPRPSRKKRIEATKTNIDRTAPKVGGGVVVLRHNSSCFSL